MLEYKAHEVAPSLCISTRNVESEKSYNSLGELITGLKEGFKASNIPISSILGETQSYARFSLPSREVLFVVGLYISFTSLFFGSV